MSSILHLQIRSLWVKWILPAAILPALASAAILPVGPTRTYKTPCEALLVAQDGDTIEIDAAGDYTGDVCGWSQNNITIRGVGGRPKLDAAGRYAHGKGIWAVYGNNIVVENIEFTGARVPDRNGAGIRFDGSNLTVRNCYFHHNENGILAAQVKLDSEIIVENSEFAYNGYGDGYSHNIYIGPVKKFVFRFNYSHHANVGHLVKTRGIENHILYNRLTTEDGVSSYEIDISNGGRTYIIGNIIQQGEQATNGGMVTYQMEGSTANHTSDALFVINNTFVNERFTGQFFMIGGGVTTPVVLRNNIFYGPGSIINQASAVQQGNFIGDPLFVSLSGYNYHLQSSSPAINTGVNPGMDGSFSLAPAYEYVHPYSSAPRYASGVIDPGAFEYSSGGSTPAPQPKLATLSLAAPSVESGNTLANNTVTLDAPAPAGGAAVALTSSNPQAASVPASVLVSAGATSASFTITAGQVQASTAVTITAAFGGVTKNAALTVTAPVVAPRLSGVSLSASSVTGGQALNGNTVTLDRAAPAGGAQVVLSSSNPAVASVPATVLIPAGALSATFAVTTSSVGSNTAVTITASYNGDARTASLMVNPQPPSQSPVTLLGISASSHWVRQNSSFPVTVTLSAPAPAGGVTVSLRSSSSAVIVPSQVTVPAGAVRATVTARSSTIRWFWVAVQLSATYNGTQRTTYVYVMP